MTKENVYRTDPSQNFIDRYPQPLDALFLPQSVAVIGAKDDAGSVGSTILQNLKNGGFKGQIYPVNPKRKEVWGLPCYPSITAIPQQIDLAVIVTPAATVPALVAECVASQVKSCIIISAGFKELGPSGIKLEEEILLHARRGKMPIIGPNCLGVMNPVHGLNATFARGMALPGNLAFISQSGAMCTAVLDWSYKEKIGFSSFVSIGSMADVNWGTLIDYLGNDPHTRSLLLYMETIGDARSFLTAAREVALEKPIIVIKAGRSQAAAKAAASHTGSLAGSDEVFDAALERVGVLRVNSISELFSMASVLSRQTRPKGPCLTIVTNAGGPAVLATDATVLNRAELTALPEKTVDQLDAFLPAAWSRSNPVDILGDASANTYAKTIEVISKDEKTDGVLVILSPQDMTDPTRTAEALVPYAHLPGKPLLASWMGGEAVKEGIKILNEAHIPVFEYPDDAAKTFAMMWRYSQNLQSLYETADVGQMEGFEQDEPQAKQVSRLLHSVQKKGRTLLTEAESKQLLSCYGIPVVETHVAKTSEEAVGWAKKMGFPLVLKLSSETITHKTDVGGVKLNLKTIDDVLAAFEDIQESVGRLAGAEHFGGVTVQRMIPSGGYELILGSSTDPQFGPVLLFGTGGQLVEVFKDSALAIPPLNNGLARRFMEKTKIYEALKGVRGRKAANMVALEELLVNFSRLVMENRRIKECDINPLLVFGDEMIALDARIVLHEADLPDSELPTLAIRPYPLNYVVQAVLRDGKKVILRPIRPEDEAMIVEFHRELSEHSVRQRYFEFMSLDERVAHERLIRICFTDYDREWTTVAEFESAQGKKIIGVGRLYRVPGTPYARFAMVIVDDYHNLGLGTELLQHLISIAKQESIEMIDARILTENAGMIKICERLGFTISSDKDPLCHTRPMAGTCPMSEPMPSDVQALATQIVKKLNAAGYTAYFAGGWVRDYLMGHVSDDIDIATDAPPEKIIALFRRTILVGLAFGIVVVVMEGHQFEVATFRKDIGYTDGRKPSQIELTTAEEDASRRDFTINGMFYDPVGHVVHDFVQGAKDIERGVVRAIGNAGERFVEDRLRMLRAVRFAARFEFLIDPVTRDAVAANAHTLFPAVAIERVWQEFTKMSRYPRFDWALIEMHRLNLLQVIFPGLKRSPLDEIKAALAAFKYFPENAETILWVMQLFPAISVQRTKELCQYLRTSNAESSLAEFLVLMRTCQEEEQKSGIVELHAWVHLYAQDAAKTCLQVIAAGMSAKQREAFIAMHAQRMEVLQAHIERLIEKKPLINAAVLLAAGVNPGKRMGALIKEAERLAIMNDLNEIEAVMDLLKTTHVWLKEGVN